MNCGLLGLVKDPTSEEWEAAYYAPKCNYLWKDKLRVKYSIVKESSELHSNTNFKELYLAIVKNELISEVYFETKNGEFLNSSSCLELSDLAISSLVVFPKFEDLSASSANEAIAKQFLIKIEQETGSSGVLQLNRNPERQIGWYIKIV